MDYGNVGKLLDDDIVNKRVPYWLSASTPGYYKINTDGKCTGYVYRDGVIQPGIKLFLYYRITGAYITSVVSDSNGHFIFDKAGLDLTSHDYFVVALHETYASAIVDKIQPE